MKLNKVYKCVCVCAHAHYLVTHLAIRAHLITLASALYSGYFFFVHQLMVLTDVGYYIKGTTVHTVLFLF